MLYIFDKDGTLCPGVPKAKGNGTRPPNKFSEQKYFPDVLGKIGPLKDAGHLIAVASNQGGVAFGIFNEAQAGELVAAAAAYIEADGFAMCPYHPKGFVTPFNIESPFRKPAPGMILHLMNRFGVAPEDTIMVGDWDSDREAAEAAGCQFIHADVFFEREKEVYEQASF
jgi:HAD superfamily hydrolase (TIGR01662 family)